jgi:periplasmic divalent cation tolerance protein
MSAFRVVFITAPPDKAEQISQKIVESRLAACVNIIESVKSIYHWKGVVKKDNESLLVVKTATKKVESLIRFIRENHIYEVPEVISVTIAEGNPDYLNWLDQETGK